MTKGATLPWPSLLLALWCCPAEDPGCLATAVTQAPPSPLARTMSYLSGAFSRKQMALESRNQFPSSLPSDELGHIILTEAELNQE